MTVLLSGNFQFEHVAAGKMVQTTVLPKHQRFNPL